jgi:hypothetical protein
MVKLIRFLPTCLFLASLLPSLFAQQIDPLDLTPASAFPEGMLAESHLSRIPSVLMNWPTFFSLAPQGRWANQESTSVNPDTGGVRISKDQDWSARVRLDASSMLNPILRGYASVEASAVDVTYEDIHDEGYSTDSVTMSRTRGDESAAVSAEVAAAFIPSSSWTAGLLLGYAFTTNPSISEFTHISDSTITSGMPYYSSSSTDEYGTDFTTGSVINAVTLSLGGSRRWGENQLSLGLTGHWEYHQIDRWYAIDSDGDSYHESVVTEQEYYLLPASQGGREALSYNGNSEVIDTQVIMNVLYQNHSGSPLNAVMLSYHLLDAQHKQEYIRVSANDQSNFEYIISSSLTSGEIMGFSSVSTELGTILFSTGTQIELTRYVQSGRLSDGSSYFHPANVNHYDEFIGADPPNEFLRSLGTFIPDQALTITVPVKVSLQSPLTNRITLFLHLSAAYQYSLLSSYGFRIDDQSIWSESVAFHQVALTAPISQAVRMQITDTLRLTLSTAVTPVTMGFTSRADGLPSTTQNTLENVSTSGQLSLAVIFSILKQ